MSEQSAGNRSVKPEERGPSAVRDTSWYDVLDVAPDATAEAMVNGSPLKMLYGFMPGMCPMTVSAAGICRLACGQRPPSVSELDRGGSFGDASG